MHKNIVALLFISLSYSLYSQTDHSIWDVVTKVDANHYTITIPERWKKIITAEGAAVDYKFDVSGVGIPAMINSSPIYASFTIAQMSGDKLSQAREQAINEFTTFYDRVSEPGYNYDTTTATIKTGETCTVLHTRFYRRSKVSNFSKYYMAIYDPTAKNTFLLNLNFQYKDPNYEIERSAQFTSYALQIFAHFELRN